MLPARPQTASGSGATPGPAPLVPVEGTVPWSPVELAAFGSRRAKVLGRSRTKPAPNDSFMWCPDIPTCLSRVAQPRPALAFRWD